MTADGQGLVIEWLGGQRREYTFAELRAACPCATCRERRMERVQEKPTLLPIVKLEELEPPRVVAMDPVGNYAYSIHFSDGHDTGIYSFELLLALGRQV